MPSFSWVQFRSINAFSTFNFTLHIFRIIGK